MRSIALAGLLMWACTAWPVSRVGTGTMSGVWTRTLFNDEVGFITFIPIAYDRFYIAADQDVRMEAEPERTFGRFEPRFMMVHMLANEQPQWVGRTDRAEFQLQFSTNGWRKIVHSESCVEHWEKTSFNGITRVLSWGNGLGVIITSTAARAADIEHLAVNLRLDPGVCSWK